MASTRTLVFITMLFCLYKLGFSTGGPQAIATPGNSSCSSSIRAGYWSRGYKGWHGVKARVPLWDVTNVSPRSSSGAYIAAINESPGLEMIAAGVHVNPSLYNGDIKVHFFTYWTSTSNYSTGCYNNYCPGFVVADGNNLHPGESFESPLSSYGGEERGIVLRIKKDESTGDWSLYREDLGGPIGGMTLLGWWPSTLFKSLSSHAEIIQWTGMISHDFNEKSPYMGSGLFASELNNRAASFTDCFGFDENGNGFEEPYNPIANIDKPSCYDVSEWYYTKHSAQRHFFFGGPGGCVKEK